MDWWKKENKCLNQWIKIVKENNLRYCISNNCGSENFAGLTCFKNISDANKEYVKNEQLYTHIFSGDYFLENMTDEVMSNDNISIGRCYLNYSPNGNSYNITCFKKNANNTIDSIEWDKIDEDF